MIKGLLIHVLLAVMFASMGAHWWMVGVAFIMRELGELKHDLHGSIWTWRKIKYSIKALFEPVILIQWALPAIVAAMI